MSYEEIESYSSHASSMVSRASDNISVIQSLLWEIKVRCQDSPHRDMVKKTNDSIEMSRDELKKALADLDILSEEMKMYKRQ